MKITDKLVQISILLIVFLAGCKDAPNIESAGGAPHFEVQIPVFPDREFKITDYGAINDGITLNTRAINDAIAACNETGGGKVVIPDGVWVTGPIQLKSKVNLHVEAGAVVLFSKDFDQYPFIQSYFEGRIEYRAMPLIYGDSLSDIAITGRGVFDGSGDAWRYVKKMKTTESQWTELLQSGGVLNEAENEWWPNEYAYQVSRDPDKYRELLPSMENRDQYKAYYRPPLVQLISCERVLLEGPQFQNSPGWCIHPLMCQHLTVNEIRVKNPWYAQNGDGIDVESCKYVSIKNAHFDVGDDAICIKSGRDEEGRKRGIPTQYVEIDQCIVQQGHGGFVVGSEMSGGVRDIWVSNCSFLGTDVGLRFKSSRGRGGVVENIHIDNIRMINIARDAIIFNLFYAGLAPTEMGENPFESLLSHAPEASEETPVFRNITINNINCQGADRAVQILGLPEMPVSGLSLTNSVFSSVKGINCLFANEIRIENVVVRTNQHPAVNMMNVSGAEIVSLSGNSDILYQIGGSETRGVVIKAGDVMGISEKILKAELVPSNEVKIEAL